MVPGTSRASETVLYGAHWDANGENAFDPPRDRIRNGAIDNGVGTATLLEVARAFAAGPRPQRTILFAGWTREEKGCSARPGMRAPSPAAGDHGGGAEPRSRIWRWARAQPRPDRAGPHAARRRSRRVAAARGLRLDPEVNSEPAGTTVPTISRSRKKGVPTVYFRAGQDL
jgi:hypothetical protein